ncbi:hypothetical protein [Azospirillum thermophilum]|uniref:Uridine kinase n=1 Tax=Azospirillum thermophilum TaxID=2202148 RepID=A0A2S2CUZ4_9PROT|nr:hypothetical protein [Azospirillum thermophilum]AWK88332.1 hypothetical protein DEW08_19780 [Azospirillum thermophilum]
MATRKTLVVAVSGPSGAGKTSLIEAAAGRLGDTARLHFDHYITLGNDIGEITAWLEAGGDPDRVATPQLASDLQRLIDGGWIERPHDRSPVGPAEFVILEEPFGRSRTEVGTLIDFAVHLDVPPDVALARRTLRLLGERPEIGDAAVLGEVEGQLRAFLAAGREAYLAADRAARAAADLVLDGMRPVEGLVEELLAAIADLRRPAGGGE